MKASTTALPQKWATAGTKLAQHLPIHAPQRSLQNI
jgi:hypothetical protein